MRTSVDDIMFSIEAGEEVADRIEELITGVPPVREPDRALATVLFTDIVGSTEHATRLGDRKWTQLLDQHDVAISRELDRHRGLLLSSRPAASFPPQLTDWVYLVEQVR